MALRSNKTRRKYSKLPTKKPSIDPDNYPIHSIIAPDAYPIQKSRKEKNKK